MTTPNKTVPAAGATIKTHNAAFRILESSTASSPRPLRTLDSSTQPVKSSSKMTNQKQVDVLELPAKLIANSGSSLHVIKTSATGDRVRGGGGGDSSIRLPIECLSKEEIKQEMIDNRLSYHHLAYEDEDEGAALEEHEEEVYDEEKMTTVLGPDRARFNTWKGVNYDLHLLGEYKSDFEKRVKSFQRPETNPITMDPFCRSESGLKDEPSSGEAFLVWKNSKTVDAWRQHGQRSSDNVAISRSSLLIASDVEEEVGVEDSDGDSLPDPEITEYMQSQRENVKEGLSPTGETPYYDEEFGTIRNLHRDSHSLTSYGITPDHAYIGKARVFYPEMSEAEKQMLTAVISQCENIPKINNNNSCCSSPRISV